MFTTRLEYLSSKDIIWIHMEKGPKIFLALVILAVVPVVLIWLPFFLRLPEFWKIPLPGNGMATIVSNYDGPLYVVVAKTLYNTTLIKANFSFDLPVEYYAAHFPLYPLLIRVLNIATNSAYAILILSLLTSLFAIYFFYRLISKYVKKDEVLWLVLMFSIFPARWLIVRSVGSPEPLFVGSVIASVYYFNDKKYWKAGFWGALAQLTKSPGILLFAALALSFWVPELKRIAEKSSKKWLKEIKFASYPILLIPLALLGIFIFYGQAFGSFWAYFNSGDNIHIFFPPFQIFNYSSAWVDTHWLEEIIFIYLIGALGLVKLIEKKYYNFAWFVGVFYFSTLFVSHRDLMRYSLPIIPFLYVAFSDFLVKREFKIAFAVIVVPIYLFSLAFISRNVMPISDWSVFL